MTVIDFKSRQKIKETEEKETKKEPSSFDDIAKKNAENEARIKEERARLNKNILRSHRIK